MAIAARPGPTEQALYVMQTEHGLIKVGRSINPERRRQYLQREHRCTIAIVASFASTGQDEERAHTMLAAHHIEGEWFWGTEEAKRAVVDVLELDSAMTWPFETNDDEAQAWVELFLDRQADQYWHHRRYRLIGSLKCAFAGIAPLGKMQGGSESLDLRIDRALNGREEVLQRVAQVMEARGRPLGRNIKEFVPPYSSDPEIAALLWLDDVAPSRRPETTSALDCCIAALCARWGFNGAGIGPRRGF